MNYTNKIILLETYSNENEIYQKEILFNWKYSKFWETRSHYLLQMSGMTWKCLEALATGRGAACEGKEPAESSEQQPQSEATDGARDRREPFVHEGVRGFLWFLTHWTNSQKKKKAEFRSHDGFLCRVNGLGM